MLKDRHNGVDSLSTKINTSFLLIQMTVSSKFGADTYRGNFTTDTILVRSGLSLGHSHLISPSDPGLIYAS